GDAMVDARETLAEVVPHAVRSTAGRERSQGGSHRRGDDLYRLCRGVGVVEGEIGGETVAEGRDRQPAQVDAGDGKLAHEFVADAGTVLAFDTEHGNVEGRGKSGGTGGTHLIGAANRRQENEAEVRLARVRPGEDVFKVDTGLRQHLQL